MRSLCAVLLLAAGSGAMVHAETPQARRVKLLCHRTANEDVPENTLESLEQAALLGCDVVEIDVRRTLDGRLVLNHDGVLERLSDGIGEAEKSYYDDLRMRDAGSWMGERFSGTRIALFEDALRVARERKIRLILDIKTKGVGADVLALVKRDGMLEQVQFNGEWADVKQLDFAATDASDGTVWVQPGVTADEVKAYHKKGKAVVVNFSVNRYAMDVAAMKAAVDAGADGINVDYPRLGADAVGRPVERALDALIAQTEAGESGARSRAILALAQYRGFPLEGYFSRWLLDIDDQVSRAAAVAIVKERPRRPELAFAAALRSEHADARANAAWALGMLNARAETLLRLLGDKDARVLQETLMALNRMPGEVSAAALLPLLSHDDPGVRGAAALALARHQPETARQAVPAQLRVEVATAAKAHDEYVRRGKPTLTQPEIDTIVGYFRCQIKMVHAISMLKGPDATQALEEQAFQAKGDFSQMDGLVTAFLLWDRVADDPRPAIEILGASESQVADRAEWMLVHGGPEVLPDVRKALSSDMPAVRMRAIRVLAWQADAGSLDALRMIARGSAEDSALAAWAIAKIEDLHSMQ